MFPLRPVYHFFCLQKITPPVMLPDVLKLLQRNVYKRSVGARFDVRVVRKAIGISFLEHFCPCRIGHSIQVLNCEAGCFNIWNICNLLRVELNLAETILRHPLIRNDVLTFDTHIFMKHVAQR